jgi:hypothetical protein
LLGCLHPQDKALVESAVRLVYQRIYYPLSRHTFFSLEQLNQAIKEQLSLYNDYCMQTSKITRRQRFIDTEQALLDPLPADPYHLRYYKRAKVQKVSHVFLSEDRSYYSVPHRYIGQYVEVQYSSQRVEVFFNAERIAIHPRSLRAGHYSTIKDHMPSSHRAYSDWNPVYFEHKASLIGSYAQTYIARLITQYAYPEIAYKQAQGILSLARVYGEERLENACKRACQHHQASYHTIERILKNNLDNSQHMPATNEPIPLHENIRGAAYYQ